MARSRGGIPDVVPPSYFGPEPIDAWYLMGGQIDWAAILDVAELLGVEDVEMLVHGLIEIRQYFIRQRAAEEFIRQQKRGR